MHFQHVFMIISQDKLATKGDICTIFQFTDRFSKEFSQILNRAVNFKIAKNHKKFNVKYCKNS